MKATGNQFTVRSADVSAAMDTHLYIPPSVILSDSEGSLCPLTPIHYHESDPTASSANRVKQLCPHLNLA